MDTNNEKKTCLYPDCGGKPITRGLCSNCYTFAQRLVTQGRVTWAWLEKTGRSLPARHRTASEERTAWFMGGNEGETVTEQSKEAAGGNGTTVAAEMAVGE